MAYRVPRTQQSRTEKTRERITAAVRDLLAEGTFHESTAEQVADRAGVSRATLYQHFRSRVDLIDVMCDTFDANPALLAVRDVVELPDAGEALAQTVANVVAFWSSEDAVLRQLYGVAAVDPAAQRLVERQRNDRRGELERLVGTLRRARLLAVPDKRALTTLLLLTSYESFRELREARLSDRQAAAFLQESARTLLLGATLPG
jgi:AcrR family transcriptional regulator